MNTIVIPPSNDFSPTQLAEMVDRECIYALYRHGRETTLVVTVVLLIFVAVLWGAVSTDALLVWFSLCVCNQIARFQLLRAFERAQPITRDTNKWARRYQLTILLGGILFGSSVIFLWPEGDSVRQLFLLMILPGIAAGGMHSNAYHPPTLTAHLLVILMPPPIWLAVRGGWDYAFAVLICFFYVGIMLRFARDQARLIRESITGSLRNAQLAEALKQKNIVAEQARQVADGANQAKTRFFAAASHDIRQPLHALSLHLGALRHKLAVAQISPAISAEINAVSTSLDSLESLFDALLDISMIDAGRVPYKPCDYRLQNLFEEMATTWTPFASQAGISLTIRPTRAVVHADPAILRRILDNLVSNAIRYTKQGGVLVACRLHGSGYMLEVWDTGIGIAKHEQVRIFDEFYRATNTRHDKQAGSGLGLGLSSVARLVALMSSSITLHSTLGRGSVFRLPLMRGDARNVLPPVTVAEASVIDLVYKRQFLVLEDDPTVADAIQSLLEHWGNHVTLAANVQSMHQFFNTPTNARPDVLIADYQLADEIDGLTAIASLQQYGLRCNQPKPLPSILITANRDSQVRSRAQVMGVPVLYKPVKPAHLRAALQSVLADSSTTNDQEASVARHTVQ